MGAGIIRRNFLGEVATVICAVLRGGTLDYSSSYEELGLFGVLPSGLFGVQDVP